MRFLGPTLKDAARLGLPGVGGVPFEMHLKELL